MAIESLAEALEHEHHEIDQGVEAFVARLSAGQSRPELLMRAIQALRRHIYLEEQLLFPALRGAGLAAPVAVMLREHGEIWNVLETLEVQLTSAGAGASMRRACRELTVRLQHHNLKEEKILYPQADRVLTAAASNELKAFLGSGQLPEGWVCERARS